MKIYGENLIIILCAIYLMLILIFYSTLTIILHYQ